MKGDKVAALTLEDLQALIAQFGQSEWRELHLQVGDIDLYLSKDPGSRARIERATVPAVTAPHAGPSPIPAPASAAPACAVGAAGGVPEGWHVVRASSLGTFYRAPKPGAAPFVEAGAAVTADSELCLIEVMKLFTTLRSGAGGTVREIYASDGDLVEFDQPLFLIEPGA